MNRVSELLARGVGEPVSRAAQAVADVATMRQVADARALRLNAALRKLASLLEDSANLRGPVILVALPWGAAGHRQWGLSRPEADALRRIVVAGRISKRGGRAVASPYAFDGMSRRWVLRGTVDEAAHWLVSGDDVLKRWPHRERRKVFG